MASSLPPDPTAVVASKRSAADISEQLIKAEFAAMEAEVTLPGKPPAPEEPQG